MSDFKVKKSFLVGLETPIAPTSANDVTNKTYVDAAVAGATNHLEAARVESDANIDTTTGGLLTIDGVTLVAGDRVLLTAQTDPIDNGVYVAAEGAWSRSADVANGDTLLSGTDIYIEEGTEHANHVQALTAEAVVGTDAQTWAHISTHTNEAENVSFDPSGNTYLTGTNVQDALDQADTELVAQDGRLDSLEADVAAIDVAGGAQTVYDANGATLLAQTIGANTWTTFTHGLGVQYPSAIAIYNGDGNLVTGSFDIDVTQGDTNIIRVKNETATVYTDMVIVVRK